VPASVTNASAPTIHRNRRPTGLTSSSIAAPILSSPVPQEDSCRGNGSPSRVPLPRAAVLFEVAAAIKRYPLPVTVCTSVAARSHSPRTCRIFRIAVLTPASVSGKRPCPRSLDDLFPRNEAASLLTRRVSISMEFFKFGERDRRDAARSGAIELKLREFHMPRARPQLRRGANYTIISSRRASRYCVLSNLRSHQTSHPALPRLPCARRSSEAPCPPQEAV